ncbi:MAG: class B sortase [Clostridiales bacterium]|nr:class B sortase [Clostridiales bacterium]
MEGSAKKRPAEQRKLLLTVAFFVFLGLAVFSATQIVLSWREYAVSGNEYDKLREMYEPPEDTAVAAAEPEDNATSDTEDQPVAEIEENGPTEQQPSVPPPPSRDPREVNPEYIGWIKINGTNISYPMAKGRDNEKYLTTSFEGYKRGLGAIFMDYRCSGDFEVYHSIIYGHNAKNGSMFGTLYKYRDEAYLEKNKDITITLPSGEKQTWRIFAARKTDINDHSYRLSFSGPESFATFALSLGAPEGTDRIITLSTCTTGGSNDERMLVHAAILETTGADTDVE